MLQAPRFAGNLRAVSEVHREESESHWMRGDAVLPGPQRMARIELDGRPVWGRVDGEEMVTVDGHRGVLRRPRGTRFLNYEGELAVVVGRRMRGVPATEALDYVAGYAPANDVGLHDFRHADRGSMLRVKGQDGFLPLGPELVPASEFDPHHFTLRTYLNGELVQEGGAEEMLWDVAYQLADVCRL